MWQPSLTVNWYNNEEKENQIETFSENISLYSYIAQSQLDTTIFAGWYDDSGNPYSTDAEGILPEITKDADSTAEYNAYAMWQPALIINYYDDSGNLLKKTISFEDVNIYSYTPNKNNFLGWYDSDGNFISLDEIGTLPALSRSNDTLFELNVYARYLEDPVIPDIIPENKPPKEEPSEENEEEIPINNTVVLEEEESTPLAFTPDFITIDNSAVPLAATRSMQMPLIGSWSLVDLLCTILVILLNIILFILGLRKNKKEDDEETEEEQEKINYHHFRRLFALIPSIGSILLFLYTQDLTQPMVLFDIWSLVFILIVLVQLIICILSYRKKEKKEEEEE